jgi:hypothetical protein
MRVHAATRLGLGRKGPALSSVVVALLLSLSAVTRCLAGGGIFGIDHELTYDSGGIWKRSYQEVLAPQSEHALHPAHHAARNLCWNRQEILGDR